MKRNFDVYQPSTLIRDFYDPASAYYRAEDIAWSPFTRIGNLGRTTAKALPLTAPRKRSNPVKTPVFPTGFSLDGVLPRSHYAKHRAEDVQPAHLNALLFGAGTSLAAIAARICHRVAHISVLPRKYSVDRGVYIDYAARLQAAAVLAVAGIAVLAMVLLGMLRDNPGKQVAPIPRGDVVATQPQPGHSISVTPAASHIQTSAIPDTPKPFPSPTYTTPSPVPAVPVSTPIVGGFGAGPIDSVLPTTVTTPPTTSTTSPSSGTTTDPVPATTPSATATIPGVGVQLGDTSLVQTSPVSVSL